MKRYIIAILSLAYTICACNNRKEEVHFAGSIPDSSEIIELSDSFFNKTFSMADFADSLTFIALETNELSILSEIRQIITTTDKIFILDNYKNGSIALFNIDGSFIKRLPSGPAPHEISRAERMLFCPDDSILYVHDAGSRKIAKFNSDGDFVSCRQEALLFSDFAVYGKEYVLVSLCNQNPYSQHIIIATDTTSYDFWMMGPSWDVMSFPYIQYTESGCLLTKKRDNAIYCYDGQKVYKKYKIIDYSSDFCISDYDDSESMATELPPNVLVFDSFFIETKNYQLFDVVCKISTPYSVFLRNRTTSEIFAIDYGRSIFNTFEHFPKISIHNYQDNVFNAVVSYQSINTKLSKSNDYRWDGSNPNNLISEADMEKLRSVKPDDNPIIVLFKLKSEI